MVALGLWVLISGFASDELVIKSIKSNMTLVSIDRPQPGYNVLDM